MPHERPYVLILGTAQDGGLPQIGCQEPCCIRAQQDLTARLFVTSLLLADPLSGKRWLIDASPDIREQTALAHGHPASRQETGPRPPLFEGVFLTHAHMGHYSGLMHLGREAYGAHNLPVYATKSMEQFLTDNGPWSLLVESNAIQIRSFQPDTPIDLGADLKVTPLVVPHRDEFSDTCAFVIKGPDKSLLYLPDIDKWDRWKTAIEDVLKNVDYALIDGTFFAEGEIPGRTMAEIPHPFITESLRRFAKLDSSQRTKIYFTHFNHTNPTVINGSSAHQAVKSAGMHIARKGMVFDL